MTSRWPLLITWALVLASASFWSYRLLHPWLPTRAVAAAPAPVIAADLTRLLGVDAPPPVVAETVVPADARFQLIGVVSSRPPNGPNGPQGAPGAADEGVALIAVDGQPAKAYRVGMVVDGDSVLQAVEARGARLGPRGGAAGLALSLPPLTEALRGQLPSAGAGAGMPTAPAAYTPPMPPVMPVPMPLSPSRPPAPAVGVAPPVVDAAPATDAPPQAFGGPPQAFGGPPLARRPR